MKKTFTKLTAASAFLIFCAGSAAFPAPGLKDLKKAVNKVQKVE